MDNKKTKAEQIFGNKKNMILLAILCCLLWSSAVPAIKKGYTALSVDGSDIPSITLFAGVRFFIAGLFVLIVNIFIIDKKRLPVKETAMPIFIMALLQVVLQYSVYYVGVSNSSGVTSTIISGIGGIFTILLSCLVYKYEKMTLSKVTGCILGLTGLAVICFFTNGDNTALSFSVKAEGCLLLSQIFGAFASNYLKKISNKVNVITITGWEFALGGLILMIIAFVMGGHFEITVSGVLLTLYLGFVSATAFAIWGLLIKYNTVSSVMIFQFLIPLFGVILSALILGETKKAFSMETFISLLFVCGGVLTINISKKSRKQCL